MSTRANNEHSTSTGNTYRPPPTTTLVLAGRDLINAIVDETRSQHLSIAFSNLKSLVIVSLADWRLNEDVLNRFFGLLRSLPNLEELVVQGFAIPSSQGTVARPSFVFLFPLTIRKLTLINTAGHSLKFMIDCIQATEVVLQSCTDIQSLPHCETLKLVGVYEWGPDARAELRSAFAEWNGLHLLVEACPFFNNAFAQLLAAQMRSSRKAIWPSAFHFSTRNCPATWTEVYGMLEVRGRLLGE